MGIQHHLSHYFRFWNAHGKLSKFSLKIIAADRGDLGGV